MAAAESLGTRTRSTAKVLSKCLFSQIELNGYLN